MYLYRCQDSLENIFTAVYRVYEDRRSREEVMLSLDDEPVLFAREILVQTDENRFGKVIRTLRRRFGGEGYYDLCLALASPDPAKAQAVYGTVASGLKRGCTGRHLFDDLADGDVNTAFRLARNAHRENCHLRGFTRFEESDQGVMYARIGPKNNLLPFLMPHFADRFPGEDFILYDDVRKLFGVHPANLPWYLVWEENLLSQQFKRSASEFDYQMLFKEFCKSISIEARQNAELQRGMLPLRFREYMTEFQ